MSQNFPSLEIVPKNFSVLLPPNDHHTSD